MLDLSAYEHLPYFGIHCGKKREAQLLVDHIRQHYPTKVNHVRDMVKAWDKFGEDTIYYPHFSDTGCMNNGAVGGFASRGSVIVEFSDLVVVPELTTERSDMDINFMLGL